MHAMSAFLKNTSLTLGLILLTSPWASAQAQEKASFSSGLKQLGELSMPDMKGAVWVKVDDDHTLSTQGSQYLRQIQVVLKGNGWRLKSKADTYLPFGSSFEMSLEKEAEEANAGADTDKKAAPTWRDKFKDYAAKNAPEEPKREPKKQKPLIEQDVDRIIASLSKIEIVTELNDSLDWQTGYQDMIGSILLFAVQIHQSGDEALANKLATSLFNAINEDMLIIDAAVNQLAENEYNEICNQLFDTGDWKVFVADLKGILKKYPRGWTMRPAVDMLAARAAAPPTTTIPKVIDGVQIDAKAHALILRLTEKAKAPSGDGALRAMAEEYGIDPDDISPEERDAMMRALASGYNPSSSGTNWLLNSPEATAESSVSEQLKAMGMDALPALAAITEDETLTLQRNEGHSSWGYSSNRGADQLYEYMTRPSSRGEIACQLLQSVIPMETDPYDSPDFTPSMLSEMALELWKNHKDSKPLQLAVLYLNEGQHSQKSSAAMRLINSDDPEAHKAFEQTMLGSKDALNNLEYVEAYISKHKQKAKPFTLAYIKILKAGNFSRDDLQMSAMGHMIQRAGGIDKYVDTLLLKIGDVSIEKIVDKALKDSLKEDNENEDGMSPIMALSESLADVELDECMAMFATKADQVKPAQWEEIIALLLGRADQNAQKTDDEGNPTPEKLKPETIKAWAELTKRDTPISGDTEELTWMPMLGCKTIGDVTTFLIDIAVTQSNFRTMYITSGMFPDSQDTLAFVQKRVETIHKGETPQAWPNSEVVSEERSEEIQKQLDTLPADQIIDYASKLTMDEKASLLEYSQMFMQGGEVPKGLVELNRSIVTLDPVYRTDHDSEFAKSMGLKVGDKIDSAMVLKIADHLLSNSEKLSPSHIIITRAQMGLGSSVQASTPAVKDRNVGRDYYLYNAASMMDHIEDHDLIVMIRIGRTTWVRVMKDDKPEWIQPDFLRQGDEHPDFEETMAKDETSMTHISIILMSREAAEPIEEQFNRY